MIEDPAHGKLRHVEGRRFKVLQLVNQCQAFIELDTAEGFAHAEGIAVFIKVTVIAVGKPGVLIKLTG